MRRFSCLLRSTLSALLLILFYSGAQANGAEFLESYANPQNPHSIFAIFNSASPAGEFLLHSNNGGKMWKTIFHPESKSQENISIYGRGQVGDFFISVGPTDLPRLVITYSDGWDIWRAGTDLRWKKYSSPDLSNYKIEKFIPTNHPDRFFAIVESLKSRSKSVLLWTDTGGASWQTINEMLPFNCSGVCRNYIFKDNTFFLVVTDGTEGYKSADGGRSWDKLTQDQLITELKIAEVAKKSGPVKGTPSQITAAFRAIKAKEIEIEEEFERVRSYKHFKEKN